MSQPSTRRKASAGQVLGAALVGFALATILNAPALHRTAIALPVGPQRTVALSVIAPLAQVSAALYLDRPRLALDAALGRRHPAGRTQAAPAASVDRTPSTPTPPPPPTGPPQDGVQTTWIIGDSLVELFGPHLSGRLDEAGTYAPEVDFKFISGLSRPDYFDWPAHMRARMGSSPPDIVVVMFGGNDGQKVESDGRVLEAWTPPWWDLYRRRVAEAMNALRAQRTRVYWIGLPVMKSEEFSRRAREMNAVYQQEAAERDWVAYVDTWNVFTDERGRYADYLPNVSGAMRLMRYEDGVHFTPHGAARLARHVFEVIDRR